MEKIPREVRGCYHAVVHVMNSRTLESIFLRSKMRSLSHIEYQTLRERAHVIEADAFGDKVLLLQDGSYLKLFRRKRLISSAALKPYAIRFAKNTRKLSGLGIPCPQVIETYRIPTISRDAVHYRPLEGDTIRQLINRGISDEAAAALRGLLLQFIQRLHATGIYFRSAHLGNIVLTPSGELGLIDVADMQFSRIGLGPFRRKRNWRHVLRYPTDRAWLQIDPRWKNLP